MNSLTTAIIALGLFTANHVVAQDYIFKGTDNSIETKLCVSAGQNNNGKLISTIRKVDSRSSYRVVNNIECNGMSLAKFAYTYNAKDTFKYLNKRSFMKNKVNTSVTIQDVAANKIKNNVNDEGPTVIYVSSKGS